MYSGLQSTCNPAVWKICALCAGPLLPLIPTFGTHHSRGTRGAPYVSYPRMACSASASQSELHRPPCTQSTGVHATKPCPECCTGRTAMFTCSQHPQFHALNKHDYVKKKTKKKLQQTCRLHSHGIFSMDPPSRYRLPPRVFSYYQRVYCCRIDVTHAFDSCRCAYVPLTRGGSHSVTNRPGDGWSYALTRT